MSLNFDPIDPNKEILGNNHPFKDGNGIAAFEDIRSYVQLSMKPKNANYILIDNKAGQTSSSQIRDNSIITLGGFYKRGKESYYSTNYTDEIMGGNQDQNKQYEGFGIKNIDITFDANKIPQVTVVFYDSRGNVINNFNSPYAQMFQIPYPIFELSIKGGFGPKITYRILKIRDDISIDEFGNYIITSKFIGDRFAPLSDLPLLYLMAVPFLDGKNVNPFNDTTIDSFHELIAISKKLYERINQDQESDQELTNQQIIADLAEQRTNYNEILNTIRDPKKLEEHVKNSAEKQKYGDEIENKILNYIKSGTFKLDENKIEFDISETIPFAPQVWESIATILIEYVDNLNGGENNIKPIYGFSTRIRGQQQQNNTRVVSEINFTDLVKAIKDLDDKITEKGYQFHDDKVIRLVNTEKQILGDTRLTIFNVFNVIINDYNTLMTKIRDAGDKGYKAKINGNRKDLKESVDRMGFPTVIDVNTNTIIYPGENSLFKDWDEVKLIEDFINAYQKALKQNVLLDALLNKDEDGRNKYIPINPREVYEIDDSLNLIASPVYQNVYFKNKTPQSIYKLMYQRFLCFANVNANINATKDSFSKWNTNPKKEEESWLDFIKFFNNNDIENVDSQKALFYSFIDIEARNIAYSISFDDAMKKDINVLAKNFSEVFFKNNSTHPLTKSIQPIAFNILEIPDTIQPFNDDYVTVSEAAPTAIDGKSISNDIITNYMLNLNNISGNIYKITNDNILYVEDKKLNSGNKESDYDNGDDTLISQIENNEPILQLINAKENLIAFDLEKLYNNCRYPALVQVPRGVLILLGSIVRSIYTQFQDSAYFKIPTNKGFIIIKNQSKFYKLIFKESVDFDKNYGFKSEYQYDPNTKKFTNFTCFRDNSLLKTDEQILEYIYTKRYISVNDFSFTIKSQSTTIGGPGLLVGTNQQLSQSTSSAPSTVVKNGITDPNAVDSTLYTQYLKVLLPKIAQLIKEDDKKLNDKLKNFDSYIQDNNVKLSIYKSFQVIYENYLHGVNDFKLEISQNKETSSFLFVDRAYRDISNECVLDLKTLLNDTNDYEVSLLSSISRLLADNNFWFYPSSTFASTAKDYKNLFKIDYYQTLEVKPKFLAIYVGGLSSNPRNTSNDYLLADDGIKKSNIPSDLGSGNNAIFDGTGLNAFLVNYTGIQNQTVFSNLQVSTESLKNTDEGLRIQSEIINNNSNSYSIPKGQSLLNVYQKQSYSSTVKIPFGNMGIQPSQYYYQECIPLFDGLYIIFNVSHTIDADTQRLETTFKGYRLKKDKNPIVTNPFVDYYTNDVYTRTLNDLGVATNVINTPAYDPNLDFWTNARNFVLGNEGFVGHCYWDINNWRIGYGSQVLALNGALKAVGDDRFNKKYFITLPNDPIQWPVNVDLDTGKIGYQKLPNGYVKEYKYFTLKAEDPKDDKYQWDAARNIKNDQYAGYVKDFYTRALADKAFDYTFNLLLKGVKKINPEGFEKLTPRGQIGATYVAYGFGSISNEKVNMSNIKAAITAGNDEQLARAIITDIAAKKARVPHQSYYNTAKYIDQNILFKLTDEEKEKLKQLKVLF